MAPLLFVVVREAGGLVDERVACLRGGAWMSSAAGSAAPAPAHRCVMARGGEEVSRELMLIRRTDGAAQPPRLISASYTRHSRTDMPLAGSWLPIV